ncbi:MAG: hypothetical protein ACREOR_11270 [Candidatus Binatia bacterium]
MEVVKIIMPTAERKPCVCGATLYLSRAIAHRREINVWLCTRGCGARGLTYEGALRRKVRVDLLTWSNLRHKAQSLSEAENQDENGFLLQ